VLVQPDVRQQQGLDVVRHLVEHQHTLGQVAVRPEVRAATVTVVEQAHR
jgi:hypothetical protein